MLFSFLLFSYYTKNTNLENKVFYNNTMWKKILQLIKVICNFTDKKI